MNSVWTPRELRGYDLPNFFNQGRQDAFGQAAAQAKDFDKLLHGEYMVTGFASCITSFTGFNPTTLQAIPPVLGQPGAYFQSFDIQGARTFNGDGTGSASGRNISVFPPNQIVG